MRKWLLIGVLALPAVFCAIASPTDMSKAFDSSMKTALVGASTALNIPADAPSLMGPDIATSPPGETGVITGTLSYPDDMIPPLRIAAFEVATGKIRYMDTVAAQSTYTFKIPVGTYHIVAYSIGGDGFRAGVAGGYTRAIPCGLAIECADHTLMDVVVTAGATTSGIDPGDFFAEDGAFPPMPGH